MARTKGKTNTLINQIKKTSKEPIKREESNLDDMILIPTGNSLLNLAISDRVNGGYGSGKIVNLVGDSNSGKTLLALSGLMEMSLDKKWDNYRLIYDDAENALEMDVSKMFGPQLAKRIQDPFGNYHGDDNFHSSLTIEDFRNNVWNALKEDKPFIYILDSYDGVTSRDELKRQEKESSGKEQKRDYPRQPAILNEALRKISAKLKSSESLVIIVSQTRDVMNAATFAAQKRRAGGKGLKFFSSHEIWLAIKQSITKEVRKKKRIIGYDVAVRSHRSKLTGKRRDVDFPVYTDYGVDDIGSMIEFLLANGFWTGSRAKINTKGFTNKPRSKTDLITGIESRIDRLNKLKDVVQNAWDDIENKLKSNRRRRFE